MTEIIMPRLSDTMEEGVISRWLKAEGDKVASGDILAEIETDKTTMDLEAYEDGVLERIIVAEGESADIGAPIAILGDGSGKAAAAAPAPAAAKAEPVKEAEPPKEETSAAADAEADTPKQAEPVKAEPTAEPAKQPESTKAEAAPTAPGRGASPFPVSPLARRLANERGIDLASVTGTGPGGLIVRRDIEQAPAASSKPAAAAAPAATAEDVEVALTNIQKITAKRLTESASTVPHFFVTSQVDAAKLLAFRADVNESLSDEGVRVSVNDLIMRAAALALEAHPRANSSWADSKLIQHGRVNVGFAAATKTGLVVPVIQDTNLKGIAEISSDTRELAGRARDGKLKPADMDGGTFTVSNLGMFGVDHFTAIINPPQAAILAVGAATDTPVARNGEVVIHPIIKLTLSVDHRVLDGAVAAAFLQEIVKIMENPLKLVL